MTQIGSYLNERHLLGLSVDNTDVPINLTNILELQITENVQNRLPSFRWRYRDQDGFLHDKAPISDGTTVGIILHSGNPRDPEDPQDMSFHVMGAEGEPTASAMNYRIAGTLDKVKFLGALAKMPINDTSNGAIKKIAEQCSLRFDGDSTQDKMPWLPKNQSMSFSDFTSFIGLHGFNNKKSVMSVGVSDDGRLIYKDLAKAVTKSGNRSIKPFALVGAGDANTIPYVHWKVKDINGFANFNHGQGVDTYQEQMTGATDLINVIESLFSGPSLNVSKAIGQLLGGAVRREFVPVDMKNTGDHAQFYQAKNQNIRGTQLFSNIIEVLTTQATGLHIYDSVDFEPVLPSTNKVATLYAGTYVVSARTRYIEKRTYYEKIRLQSNSGGNGNSNLQGSN